MTENFLKTTLTRLFTFLWFVGVVWFIDDVLDNGPLDYALLLWVVLGFFVGDIIIGGLVLVAYKAGKKDSRANLR